MYKKGERCKFMLIKNDTMKALYSTDLQQFLKKADLLTSFMNGKLKCSFCDETISERNLYAFIPNGDHFVLCCTNPECIISLSQEATK